MDILGKLISFFVGAFFSVLGTNYKQLNSDINRLKKITDDFLDKELPNKQTPGSTRKIFYKAIRKHFSDYKRKLETYGYKKFLSRESTNKIDSILAGIKNKYNNGEGNKADEIRAYCQDELNELKILLQRDINLPLYKYLFNRQKDC